MNDNSSPPDSFATQSLTAARWILGVALIYAAITRTLYLLWASDNSPFFVAPISDALMYHNWALEISRGRLLSDQAFYQAPLYPYFLSAVYYLFGSDPWPIRIIQSLLGLGNILLIYRIARYQTPAVWAAIASALAALYFGFAFHEGFLLLETLGLHLVLWSLFLCLRANQSKNPAAWVLAGLAIGLACLARPNSLLLLPLLGAWLLFVNRKQPSSAAVQIGALVVGAGVAIMPATLHNWVVSHKFALVTTNAGTTFAFGNNPGASGVLSLPPGFSGNILTQRQEELEAAQQFLNHPITREEAARYWLYRSLQFLAENPGFAVRLEYLKLRRFLNNYEVADNYSMHYDTNPYKALMPLPFAVILGFAAWGMVKAEWRSPAIQLITIFLLVPAATVMLFYMTARYRLPAVPMLIVFAVVGARSAFTSSINRQWVGLAVAVYSIGFVMYVSLLPMSQGDRSASWRVREGVAWLQVGRPDKALERLALARGDNPKEQGLWLNTALAYYKENQLPQALDAVNKAIEIELDAVKPEAIGLKGAILLGLKQYPEAERTLKQGLELAPHNGKFHLALAMLYQQTRRHADARTELQRAQSDGTSIPAELEQAIDIP